MNDIRIKRLREVITEKGWTQKRIAEECGYTQQYISNLLKGIRPVSAESAKAIGEALGVDPEYITGESDFKNKKDYWKKSMEFHGQFEGKILEMLEMLNIQISAEPVIVERHERRMDEHLNVISDEMTERSQVYKVSSPTGEKFFTESDLMKMKDDLVKSIITRLCD